MKWVPALGTVVRLTLLLLFGLLVVGVLLQGKQHGSIAVGDLAPTSAVVPFQYIQLVWAMLLGFAIWGDLPTLGLLLGSAVVICSGLFLFWHETRRIVEPDT